MSLTKNFQFQKIPSDRETLSQTKALKYFILFVINDAMTQKLFQMTRQIDKN